MHARVTRFKGEPANVEEGIRNIKENIAPNAKKMAGFKHGYWVVDRKTGEGFAMTVFGSEADIAASEDGAKKLRAQAETTGNRITSVERYEVVAES